MSAALVFGFIWPTRWYHIRRLALAVFVFFAGAWRFEATQESSLLGGLENQGVVSIEGHISREPDVRDTASLVRVDVKRVLWQGVWHDMPGTVQLRVTRSRNLALAYNDHVIATGVLRPAAVIDTFNYDDYLTRQGIDTTMSPQNLQVLMRNDRQSWRSVFIQTKQRAETTIADHLPEPHASLLQGILLGDDKAMPATVRDAFNTTSTSHIIAISGFNMTILAAIVAGVLQIVIDSKFRVLIFSGVFVIIYTIFVGASPAVLRAACMSLVVLYGRVIDQKTFVPASLAAVTLLLVGISPWVLWDIGFQLSFAAVTGMVLLVPPLEQRFKKMLLYLFGKNLGTGLARLLTEAVVVSFAAQVFVLPLILYYFGRLSVLSLVANVLIVPAQVSVLGLGVFATITTLIIPQVGQLLFAGVWLPLEYTLFIVEQLAAVRWASAEIRISAPVLAVCVCIGAVWVHQAATNPRRLQRLGRIGYRILLPAIILAMSIAVLGTLLQQVFFPSDGKLHVTYMDAGLSNSVLIASPDGAVFLIDGGRYPSRLLHTIGNELPPHQRNIDALFITSDAFDDIGALTEVAKRYHFTSVFTAVSTSREQHYHELIAQLTTNGSAIIPAAQGHRIRTEDGVAIDILAPDAWRATGDAMVIRLQYGTSVFLFVHDLGTPQEQLLIANADVRAHVVQLADHGRSDSNSSRWVTAVDAQIAILQNDPAHFESEAVEHVLQRFDNQLLWRTDQHGSITVVSDGSTLEVKTEHVPD